MRFTIGLLLATFLLTSYAKKPEINNRPVFKNNVVKQVHRGIQK